MPLYAFTTHAEASLLRLLENILLQIYIKRDHAGNIKPDKEKFTEKIDDAVAMIMALDRAIRCECMSDDSIYDSREMSVF